MSRRDTDYQAASNASADFAKNQPQHSDAQRASAAPASSDERPNAISQTDEHAALCPVDLLHGDDVCD